MAGQRNDRQRSSNRKTQIVFFVIALLVVISMVLPMVMPTP